ncbi:anthocyanidin 3-O-glucosyltransferase 2-like [Coffea eugenioides]|uniref:Glycosyltransferase n=1 Tax=Coffea arabica TaxID=13443 RepID=A0A6P6UIF7_COFAR|nr:anthocyanidin 3-O-glucosyltransferase 2-like [Coffea arabica]XP_027149398.1 anthocyanidin 3-O-glucosyltransferase 2-like [Coffea eugenioides]
MKAELIFIPLPAIGHLVSMVQFAKLLVSCSEEFSINLLLFKLPFDAKFNSYIQSLYTQTTRDIQFIQLPDPQLSSQPDDPLAIQSALIDSNKPHVRDFVAHLKHSGSSKLVGLVVDLMCTSMIDIAKEFEIHAYVFYPCAAAILGLSILVQGLVDDNQDTSKYKDSDHELSVSTYINPVPAKLIPESIFDEEGINLKIAKRVIAETKGIMVNTFLELELYAIKALTSNPKIPPIYQVGPLINDAGISSNQEEIEPIIRWLDDQPTSSVIFFCFGSFGSFDSDQVKEIACAIELSGCRFLWSLRRPPPKGRLEYPSEYENLNEVLPEGFLKRIADTGKVIGWAPQAQVLAHTAVGGFVTHCGWNSVLESVWFGVPMAVWPMYAEQHMNAFFAVKDLGIAVEIKMDYMKNSSQVMVKAAEIEKGIRQLMEPEGKIRKRVRELKEKARTSLIKGGSSYISLESLLQHLSCFS